VPNVLQRAVPCGATVLFRSYSPGLGTAVVVVFPVVWYLNLEAVNQGLISRAWCLAAFVVAGMVHALDIYTTVLFRFSKNESAMRGV
jgi:hypothetical protein